MDSYNDRLPLPSEDEGDLVNEPAEGMTDDSLVATEEGVPWNPPTERVIDTRADGSADAAGAPGDDAGELERDSTIQGGEPPTLARDDELRADVVETLRASDVLAGDRLRVAVTGDRVVLTGEVESVDVLDEVLGIVGDVPGVGEVVDEVEVSGV